MKVKNLTEKEKGDLKLQSYAKKGYRYHTWYREPLNFLEKKTIAELKHKKEIDSVRTFKVNSCRIVVIKENELAYEKEFNDFIKLLKRCNLRKKRVKNPFYCSWWNYDSYWIKQEELREELKKKWFDIVQHIIYNNTGIVNPNLPEGSVYNKGYWGRKIVHLEKHFPFLR